LEPPLTDQKTIEGRSPSRKSAQNHPFPYPKLQDDKKSTDTDANRLCGYSQHNNQSSRLSVLSHCLTTTTQAFYRSKSSRWHVTREGKLAILPPSRHNCGSTQSGLALTCRSKSPTIRKLAYYGYLSVLSFTHAFTQPHQKYFLRKELDSTQLENPSHCCTPFHSAPKFPKLITGKSQIIQHKVVREEAR
jgi:hypothetical protein